MLTLAIVARNRGEKGRCATVVLRNIRIKTHTSKKAEGGGAVTTFCYELETKEEMVEPWC
jgi:hypothetical protein